MDCDCIQISDIIMARYEDIGNCHLVLMNVFVEALNGQITRPLYFSKHSCIISVIYYERFWISMVPCRGARWLQCA